MSNASEEMAARIRRELGSMNDDDVPVILLVRRQRDEIERLRAGYERLRDASDSEMRDGDLARDIAAEMLSPNEELRGGHD